MMLKIYFDNTQEKILTDEKLERLIERAIIGVLEYEKFPYNAEVSVTFCDNDEIRKLNMQYRGKDTPTDVLSFPMYDFRAGEKPTDAELAEIGDIVISIEKALEQSEIYGHSFKREMAFLTVHSVLHLLGYDHELSPEDEADMFSRQDAIMEILQISRDE